MQGIVSYRASNTAPTWWRLPLAVLALVSALGNGLALANESQRVVLAVPYRSQFDGTPWGSSNCGPASLGMVLSAFRVGAPTMQLRELADGLLGFADPEQGTRMEDLARIATERGLVVNGPYDDSGARSQAFRRWTLDEARAEILAGRPLIIEVYYPLLPNHRTNPVDTDHYIVLVGVQGDDFIFNDSANSPNPGYRVQITTAELRRSWGNSIFPFGGFSVGSGTGTYHLQPYPAEREGRPWQWRPTSSRLPRAY